jgi:hypothetical protein
MLKQIVAVCVLVVLGIARLSGAERINQDGRILGPLLVVTNALLFNTTNADAVVSAMQIFPVTNPWNEDISRRSVLINSDAMIAQISADLLASRRTLRLFQEMNFVLAPDNQPLVPIQFVDYPDESDLNGGASPYGRYPIPATMPVEGWPTETSGETLAEAQQDALGLGGDRHSIVVQPGSGTVWETWQALLSGTNWQASNGALFNLNTNGLRPAGWTSGDAAGLPMFPALVRFDEGERGMVEHACRIVVKRTRYRNYLYPATHYAASSANTNVNLPMMGQRLRLKAGFVIPANWTKQERALLLGLKKYGALVADNGNFFSISITPDDRWPAGAFDHISSIGVTEFEVIQATGPDEGPRSPGAPTANAGPDQALPVFQTAQLQGAVSYTGTPPVVQWKFYSGPGTVTFGNAAQTNTTASFSTPGTYTLRLSADDGVHAVAYDAAVFTVTNAVRVTIARADTNVRLTWQGGVPPFVVQQADALPVTSWNSVATTSQQSVTLPMTNKMEVFRVRAQ